MVFMRLLFIITAIILLLPMNTVMAEEHNGFGLILGGSNTSLFGDDVERSDDNQRFILGGYFCHNFNEYIAMQYELQTYIRETDENEELIGDGGGIGFSYFEIPVLLKIKVPNNTYIQPNFFVGFSYRMKYLGDEIDFNLKDTEDKQTLGSIGDSEVLPVLGFSVDMKLNQQIVSVAIQYRAKPAHSEQSFDDKDLYFQEVAILVSIPLPEWD